MPGSSVSSGPVLSYQLYSSRHAASMTAEIARLSEIGFEAVEPFEALYDDLDGLRRSVSEAGLAVPSGHFGLALLEDDFNRALTIAKRLGMRIVVMPYLPAESRPESRTGWQGMGRRLRALADRLAAEGLRLAYHNHDFEFCPLPDGTLPIELVLGEDIFWEADLAWVVKGGADPAAWLGRYAGRVPLVHVKDIAPAGEARDEEGWADVGAGLMPWAALWPLCRKAGAQVMVAEHDLPSDPERFARRSHAAMSALNREGA